MLSYNRGSKKTGAIHLLKEWRQREGMILDDLLIRNKKDLSLAA